MAKPFVPRFKKKTSPNRNIVKDIKSLANIVTAIPRTLIEEVSIATSKKQKPTPSGVTKKKDASKKDTSTKPTTTKDTDTKTQQTPNSVRMQTRQKELDRRSGDTPQVTVTTEQDKIKNQIKGLQEKLKITGSERAKSRIQEKIKKLQKKLK
jgi:hypothetical protein